MPYNADARCYYKTESDSSWLSLNTSSMYYHFEHMYHVDIEFELIDSDFMKENDWNIDMETKFINKYRDIHNTTHKPMGMSPTGVMYDSEKTKEVFKECAILSYTNSSYENYMEKKHETIIPVIESKYEDYMEECFNNYITYKLFEHSICNTTTKVDMKEYNNVWSYLFAITKEYCIENPNVKLIKTQTN